MEIFLYTILFIIGIFFGSFFTLAVYRIPKKEDILIKHSYCPNCNHKLGFFDLFPVFSFVFLGGKCRYCENKIRARYLILEILAGITFVIIAFGIKIDIFNIKNIIELAFLLIYISILFIIAGIDKENIKIEKKVLFFGFVIEILYMIYQYTLGIYNVYQYVIYLILFIILLILSIIDLKINLKEKYCIQILYLCLYIIFWCGSKIYILSSILTFLIIAIKQLVSKHKKLPIGFLLSISNIIVIIVLNVLVNYIV